MDSKKITLITVATISAVALVFASNVQKPIQAIDVSALSSAVTSPTSVSTVRIDPVVPVKPAVKPGHTQSSASSEPTLTAQKYFSVEKKTIQPAVQAQAGQSLVEAMLETPVTHSVFTVSRVTQEVPVEPIVINHPAQQPVKPKIVSAPALPATLTAAPATPAPNLAIYTELAANHKSTSAGLGLIYNNLIGADIYTTNTHNSFNTGIGAGLQVYASKNLLSFLPESLGLYTDIGTLYHSHPGSVTAADSAGHLAYKPSGSEWLINYGGGVNIQIPVKSTIVKNTFLNLGYGSVKGATVGLGLSW